MRNPIDDEIKKEIYERYLLAIESKTCVKIVVMWAQKEKGISR